MKCDSIQSMEDDRILVVDLKRDAAVIKGLSSDIRVDILFTVQEKPQNINEISAKLNMPQSTVATNVAILEKAGLIQTENVKGKKGVQKICHPVYREIVIQLHPPEPSPKNDNRIEVEMPIGLYTRYEVTAPCGLCSTESIIGYLDVPESFLDPGRMKAGLIWFETGFIEYKFPNNSLYKDKPVTLLELSAELSSEIPGTNQEWRSDITVWINGIKIGTWTSPGDYGDRRGKLTPAWWKLEGSQYGLLKNWRINHTGSYVDGVRISDVTLNQLALPEHHSIKVCIGVERDASHVGGMNIFGRGFGNYDQDLILRTIF